MDTQTKTSFLKLYEPIHSQFTRYCRAISGNSDDSDDLMQDSILNALERFDYIKDKRAFKSYLFSIASNLHKMKLRRKKFQTGFNDQEIKQIIDSGQKQDSLTDFRIVYETMLSLPDKMAEALILFHISDISIEEIQKIQGGSLSGVKSRLKRGREKLISRLTTREQVRAALIFLTL